MTGDEIKNRQLACHSSLVTCHLPSTHANALHRLKKLAFGFDGGSDDDLGLLKFGNVFRADVAHASGDRRQEILTAVINLRWAEENLFQRTSGANFDPGASGQVDVRSGHSPMITGTGRFLRSSKRAPNHDCIRSTGERLANVAAF